MSSELIVRPLAEPDYVAWLRLVGAAPSGSIYATPDYLSALCQVTDAKFRIIGVFKGTELLGGMPLYETQSPVGTVATHRLLLYYHSPVIREYVTQYPSERMSRQLAIMQSLLAFLKDQPLAHLRLHIRHPISDVRPFLQAGWTVRPLFSYIVPIADLQATWSKTEQNLRRLVERAESKGIVMTQDDDFDSFYRLHLDTHKRKGAPLYLPQNAFERFYQLLRDKNLGQLFQARSADGRVIATQLVLLGPNPVCHIVCAAADSESLTLGSTPFLRWKAFQALSELGYKGVDLTDAALNDVTRFKSQLGGELVTNWIAIRPETPRYFLYQRMVAAVSKGRQMLRRWKW
jgi:hypothetical protein